MGMSAPIAVTLGVDHVELLGMKQIYANRGPVAEFGWSVPVAVSADILDHRVDDRVGV